MKRLKYVGQPDGEADIIYKTIYGNTYTFTFAENYELDIADDQDADSLLCNHVFQDITE